jgi:steroid delta-isomerase
MNKILCTCALVMLTGCAAAPAGERADDRTRDQELLRRYIIESGEALNRRDLKTMMGRVAPDLVLTFPGVPDIDYSALQKGYAEMIAQPETTRITTVPTVQEVMVSGDLGIVRVTWTTTIEVAGAERKVRSARDMQVWRRTAGEWQFVRGMYFHEPAR